ncbi:MAG: triphosphoribosyl-dephospho-CoA synthase [Chromatiales bacterium]
MTAGVLHPIAVERVVREVCCLEVRALKPGNVSVQAAGHGMTAEDFLRSADAVAPILGALDLTVGGRILRSTEATMAVVGCNTNLGMVLLLAPLAQAALTQATDGKGLRERLWGVLESLTIADAVAAYAAIRTANPGGLGHAPAEDVAASPTVTLLAAMRLAAHRDRIAFQYASGYADVFETGLSALCEALAEGVEEEWAVVMCYLRYLAKFPDSHVARKAGMPAAEHVRRRAEIVESGLKACDNPHTAVPMLLGFDEELKRGGFNPGTSADLTVATLAACRFEALLVES